jgi:hypothetical protein
MKHILSVLMLSTALVSCIPNGEVTGEIVVDPVGLETQSESGFTTQEDLLSFKVAEFSEDKNKINQKELELSEKGLTFIVDDSDELIFDSYDIDVKIYQNVQTQEMVDEALNDFITTMQEYIAKYGYDFILIDANGKRSIQRLGQLERESIDAKIDLAQRSLGTIGI